MRRHLVLLISVGLNAVLLAVLLLVQPHRPVSRPHYPEVALVATNIRNHVVVRKQFFSWQEVESADYQAYVNHLRDIGCPEQTIRDIIVADVNALYARKRLTDVPTPDQQWWRSSPDPNLVSDINAKIQALDYDRRALLAKLLGANWEVADAPPRTVVQLSGPVLGDLSADVKRSVQDILSRSQLALQTYLDTQKAAGKNPDPSEIARLAKQMRTDLAQVLNPTQMEEFLLRYSQSAASLREQLKGVEVTPDEFRNLFHLTDPLEQQLEQLSGTSQAADIQKELQATLKSVLGPDRYAAYQLAQDPLYTDAVAQVADAGAPAKAVRQLYELNKATLQEEQRIRNDPSLTPDQVADQIKAVEAQAQLAGDQILGLAPATPAAPAAPPAPAPPTPVAVHSYSPGETVDQIAAKYGVTSTSIINANPNVNFDHLTRGAAINIPPQQ
jgi:hypothetical protein